MKSNYDYANITYNFTDYKELEKCPAVINIQKYVEENLKRIKAAIELETTKQIPEQYLVQLHKSTSLELIRRGFFRAGHKRYANTGRMSAKSGIELENLLRRIYNFN